MRHRIQRSTLVVVLPVVVSGSPAAAQSLSMHRGGGGGAQLELLRPFFEGVDEGFGMSVWYVSGYGRVAPGVRVVGEIPFAISAIDAIGPLEGFDTESSLGNVYLGVEFAPLTSDASLEVGLRIPSGGEDAAFVGLFTDLIDRPDAFFEKSFALVTLARYRHTGAGGFGIEVHGSPRWIIPREGGDTEVFIGYGVRAGYDGDAVSLLAGPSGVLIVTGGGNLGDRTFHQVGLAAQLKLGVVRPGAELRVPLDSQYQDLLDAVLGVSLTIVPGARR